MHELAATDNCVSDPEYHSSMCGFTADEGCTPLNGCGSPVAYILLNIFIAVILEGFANEKDQANGVLLPQHVRIRVA